MNEHVRVDLIYGSASYRARAWIDLIGGIFFLIPICVVMIHFSWPWFLEAWTTMNCRRTPAACRAGRPSCSCRLGFALVLLQGTIGDHQVRRSA